MCCGVGPCAQVAIFKKETDEKWVGTGDSLMAGGCCKGMMHNNGDIVKFGTDEQGPYSIWQAGNSMAYPPCFHGKEIIIVRAPKGGSPQAAEMER